MKVLVTGGTGFLGSHLVKKLVQEKHTVIILKRSFSNTFRIKSLLDKVVLYDIDIYDFETVFREQGHIDVIIHTATCYGRQGESIKEMHKINTTFPLELIDTAIKFKVSVFINTDTILPKHLNNYAFSKFQFMEWGKVMADRGEIGFINVRLEHIYGPDDDETKFISYVIKACLNCTAELHLTKGEQKRDFVYIDDVVNAYLILLEQTIALRGFAEYDVGSGKLISIKELVELIQRLTQSKIKLNFGSIPYRANEMMKSISKVDKLAQLGWSAQESIESGVKKCIGDVEK